MYAFLTTGRMQKTFERLGIPEQERKFLAGVGAQYDFSRTLSARVVQPGADEIGALAGGGDDGPLVRQRGQRDKAVGVQRHVAQHHGAPRAQRVVHALGHGRVTQHMAAIQPDT